jgi:hypothetical protein
VPPPGGFTYITKNIISTGMAVELEPVIGCECVGAAGKAQCNVNGGMLLLLLLLNCNRALLQTTDYRRLLLT